jgi:hypothetical protein
MEYSFEKLPSNNSFSACHQASLVRVSPHVSVVSKRILFMQNGGLQHW